MDVQEASATIRALIVEKYKSLEEPRFSFVDEALAARPYDPVALELLSWFWVFEDTDTNYDVAFEYLLRDQEQAWRLELSMLGRYAALLRTGAENLSVVIAPGRDDFLPREEWLLGFLQRKSITVLPQEILATPLPINLTNAELDDACIYHALFTDIAAKPWEPWQPRTETASLDSQ